MAKEQLTNSNLAPKPGQKYTIEDWRQWPEDERWELIEGKAWCMTPSPPLIHQQILGDLAVEIYSFLMNKTCEVYIGPLDVYLSRQ